MIACLKFQIAIEVDAGSKLPDASVASNLMPSSFFPCFIPCLLEMRLQCFEPGVSSECKNESTF